MSSRSVEVFRAIGCERLVRARAENVPLSIAFAESVTSADLQTSCAIAPAEATRASSPCAAAFVPQDQLELALRERVAESPSIRLLSGTRLEDFRDDGATVRCDIEGG